MGESDTRAEPGHLARDSVTSAPEADGSWAHTTASPGWRPFSRTSDPAPTGTPGVAAEVPGSHGPMPSDPDGGTRTQPHAEPPAPAEDSAPAPGDRAAGTATTPADLPRNGAAADAGGDAAAAGAPAKAGEGDGRADGAGDGEAREDGAPNKGARESDGPADGARDGEACGDDAHDGGAHDGDGHADEASDGEARGDAARDGDGSAADDSSASDSDSDSASPPAPTSDDPPRGPLPDGVRQRVIALAADGLGAMTADEIPVPLRQFARFTPSRRAKLAATPLAGALENDPVFRQRIAERLRRGLPDLAAALDAGRPPAAADPLDVAAAAYLLRPPGWTALLDTAGHAVERAAQDRASAEAAAVVERLESELGALRASARTEQEKLRADLEEARKEAEQLRRQVRGLQGGAKHAEKEAKLAKSELESVRAEAQAAIAAADKETRRLRGRVSEVESALEASRRAAREGRSMEDTRLRLLLDTVLEAAQGLRRELALPPVGIRPADTVDAVEPEGATPKDIAKRALEGDDPALLDQLLSLPQAHLVIDGYNVTKTGYPTLALQEQRVRLLGGLAVIAAQTGCEITCVFDGAQLDAPVLLAPPRGVRVRFSKAGETADELIRRLVRAEPPGRPVIVVSSDREVADGVRRAGARPVPSTMLLRRLSRG